MKRTLLHPAAFSLFGVIVGLAIREALLRVVPLITSPATTVSANSGFTSAVPVETSALMLYSARVLVFLMVTIRFYLGSAYYFTDVYLSEDCDKNYPYKSYGLDYLIGLIHFLVFFAWATTVADAERQHVGGASHFLGVAAVILLYDLAWLAVCWRYDTSQKIKLWTFVNVSTVVVGVGIFFGLSAGGFEAVFREEITLIPIAIVSLIDIAEIINRKPYIANALARLISKGAEPPRGSAA